MKRPGLVLLLLCVLAPGARAGLGDDVRTVTLRNGLTVVLAPDPASPVVDVAVWYRAGTRDERAGLTGISHLFEHLMFRGSANVAPGEHLRTLQADGAQVGAFTTADYTCFHQTLAPSALDAALRLEADRMRGLRLTAASLEAERSAVRAERRGRSESSPLGRGLQRLYELAWPGHPYRWPVIGLEADLERITLEECRRWHQARYAPGNAVLTVVGGIEPDSALARVKRWFEPVPRRGGSGTVVPAPAAARGAQRAEERLEVQVPLIAAGWRAFGAADPDAEALEALARILAHGQESRLQRSLVRDARQAVFVQSGVDGRRDGQLFYVVAAATPGADAAAVEAALVAEVERLASEDVSEEELARARRQLEASHRFGLQTARGRAAALAVAELHSGAARAAEDKPARVAALTAADLRRAAGRVLRESGRNVVWVRPAPAPIQGGAR